MSLFRKYLTNPADAAVTSQVTLPISINFDHEGKLETFSATVQSLLSCRVTDDNIARSDVEAGNVK